MRRLQWNYLAWEDYCQWQRADKSALKRINLLIRDIMRDPFAGVGKPEPLKGKLSGFWSRRIDEGNRLVYAIEDSVVVIISCKGHYE
ncbi:MAG: Txe/YoeB family addiction module toxin [Lawsonibacter sp.]|nr:Txe/YoeB family addiction module toxin [Lawsonibacter sp.]